jgi:ribosomal protein S18 acetylase RimI-like enzyme
MSRLFDERIQTPAATRFLASEEHHILVAYQGPLPVGFVTGVELTHPDKGTEMFLYELAVDEKFQRQGHGIALVRALAAIALDRGCYGMWAAAEEDNLAALATYSAAGATRAPAVILAWEFAAKGALEKTVRSRPES